MLENVGGGLVKKWLQGRQIGAPTEDALEGLLGLQRHTHTHAHRCKIMKVTDAFERVVQ